MLLLLLVAPSAGAAQAPREPIGPPPDVGVAALVSFPIHQDPWLFALAQMERQGQLPMGTIAAASADAAAAEGPRPPALLYRDVHPVCDVDADGVPDAFSNDITLTGPPSHSGPSTVRAISGATGEELWAVANLFFTKPSPGGMVATGRAGSAFPEKADNVIPTIDADGDGICDVVAFGLDDTTGTSAPLVGSPSLSYYPSVLRVISGKDGSVVWSVDLQATVAQNQEPFFSTYNTMVVRDMPSGMIVTATPKGPRVVLKTTDLEFALGQDWTRFSSFPLPVTGAPLFPQSLYYESLTVVDRVRAYDASGEQLWMRELASGKDSQYTNLSWLAGAADLDGDGEPEVALDQLTIANPRGNEANAPFSQDRLFRYGRGMRMTTLDGATGETEWHADVLAPLPVEANPPQEESYETISFTHGGIVDDLDGDGVPEVLASYVAREEQLATTTSGAYRTHFVPLSGVNGTALWDVKQTGWGYATGLDGADDGASSLLGLGMIDVPTGQDASRRFPQKYVRLVVLDVRDGAVVWSYERAFTQNSYLAYNLALAQFADALAPVDLDRDGILDLVTPSQYATPTGRDQVLLATSSHTYEVKSGLTGATLATMRAWGPDGRLVRCAGEGDTITVLTGHSRRLDLTRFDGRTGEELWRQPVHNDPAPRAAVAGIDLTGVGAACGDRPDGSTLFAVNVQAFSFDRRHEVIPILGVVRAAAAEWIDPPVRGEPSNDIILLSAPLEEPEPAIAWETVALGAIGGALAAVATVALLARPRLAPGLLGVGIVLLLMTSSASPALAPVLEAPAVPALAVPDAVAAPEPTGGAVPAEGLANELIALGEDWTIERHMEAVARHFARSGYAAAVAPTNETGSGYYMNSTLTFTYEAGDLDGDGHEDLIFNQYCTDTFVCGDFPSVDEDPVAWATYFSCDWPHELYAVSGRTGKPLWRLDLFLPQLFLSCGQNFVLGTIQDENGTGILVYRYNGVYSPFGGFGPGAFVFEHDIMRIDARTGETSWTYHETGAMVTDFLGVVSARNIVLHPVLQMAPTTAIVGMPRVAEDALFVQGIGFDAVVAHTIFTDPLGFMDYPIILLESYAPVEWAARIDLRSGAEDWRAETFTRELQNVVPRAVDWSFQLGNTLPLARGRYWQGSLCCFDGTGDGIPDLMFRVYRYTNLPNLNVNGPHMLDVSLRMYDGATGAMVTETLIQEDLVAGFGGATYYPYANALLYGVLSGYNYDITPTPLGDVDGDGTTDLMLDEEFYEADYVHAFSVRSGKDLSVIWSMNSTRDLRIVPLGDANGDGGSDLLAVDWYGFENGAMFQDEYVAPAATPLRAFSGRDGSLLWRVETYQAPTDVVLYFDTLLRNGLPDVNGDGVADVVVDAPQYLADQSVIHEQTVLSGRDATPLYGVRSVGAFAVPARVDDITADGVDDLAFLSGDVYDLWLTLHSGSDGTAEWSRRVVSLPASGYAQVLPLMRFFVLDDANSTRPSLALDMMLDVTRISTYISICVGCDGGGVRSGEVTGTFFETMPQTLRLDGRTGGLGWAIPELESYAVESSVRGATPGAKAYDQLLAAASMTALDEAREAAPKTLPALAGFAAGFLLVGAAAVAIVRGRAKMKEVPDLV